MTKNDERRPFAVTTADFRKMGVLVRGATSESDAIDRAYKHLGLQAYHDVTVGDPLRDTYYVEFTWDYSCCDACGSPPAMEHLSDPK